MTPSQQDRVVSSLRDMDPDTRLRFVGLVLEAAWEEVERLQSGGVDQIPLPDAQEDVVSFGERLEEALTKYREAREDYLPSPTCPHIGNTLAIELTKEGIAFSEMSEIFASIFSEMDGWG